ncbi:hypothetical protein GN330_00480 [Nitratireductor sp. CAU 1489]|uniref:Flagellar basal body-associated protein FliL n=1 Tax=Nitratireductor arenosus TaxID=2682096 RepID=A0A844QA04_9HYPH|nr:hypothetical protein [Nitratireductor arenosus]MVA95727.1 hypothetical protein [Nitratireductor arenosus]
MIKFVIGAVWIVAVTIGSIFFAFSATGDKGDTGERAYLEGLDYYKTEIVSVPVIQKGEVRGYFLTRLIYTVEPEKLKKLELPLDTLLVDQLYTYLFSNPQIDFSQTDVLDLVALRNGLRDSINARVGDKLVEEVLVQQIDYLTKSDIRDNALRRRDADGGQNRPVLR